MLGRDWGIEGSTMNSDERLEPFATELKTLGHEAKHVFGLVVQDLTIDESPLKVMDYVTCDKKMIFKSTLASQLVVFQSSLVLRQTNQNKTGLVL